MARLFNGTSDSIEFTAPKGLGQSQIVSVSWWEYNDAAGSAERISWTSQSAVTAGQSCFYEPRYTAGVASINMFATAGGWVDKFTQPSSGVWHHYLAVCDRTIPLNTIYVDAIEQSLTTVVHTMAAGTYYTESTWYMMRYPAAAWFYPGRLAEFAVWSNVRLNRADALMLSRGVSPLQVRPDRLLFFMPMDGAAGNREPVYGRMGALLPTVVTLNGTTGAAHPFGYRAVPRPTRKALVTV